MPGSDVHVLGNFPPPVTGQAMATQRLADLLERSFDVHCDDLSPGDLRGVEARVHFRLSVLQHFLSIRGRLRSSLKVHPHAPVVWTSISPTLLGHLRDLLITLPLLQPQQRLYAAVHWGNFEQVFRSPFTGPTARRLAARIDSYVFLNQRLADACARWIPPEKRHVIPNTLRAALLCTEAEVAAKQARRRDRQHLRLLFLSNMIPSKGYLDVLEAVHLLHRRHVPVVIDYAGGWEADRDAAAFHHRVAAWRLEGVVRHHGPLYDPGELKRLYLEADLFLLPTYYPNEAQPLTIIEALNAGTPVVATQHAGIPEMVQDGREACLVPPHDPAAIAEAVEHMTSFGSWLRLSRNARCRFTEVFSPEAIQQQWEALLQAQPRPEANDSPR